MSQIVKLEILVNNQIVGTIESPDDEMEGYALQILQLLLQDTEQTPTFNFPEHWDEARKQHFYQ